MPLMRLARRYEPTDLAGRLAGAGDLHLLIEPKMLPQSDSPTGSGDSANNTTSPSGGRGGDGVAPPATSSVGWLAVSYSVVAASAAIAVFIRSRHHPAGFTPGSGISVFAPLYILTQAIERFLEPLSSFVTAKAPSAGEKATKESLARNASVNKADAIYNVNLAIAHGHAHLAAEWQAAVDQIRKNTAILAWMVASALALLACGTFGLYMMRMVGFNGVPKWADVIITGLAVGAGTKPLHDLIANLQTAKDGKEDPKEKAAA